MKAIKAEIVVNKSCNQCEYTKHSDEKKELFIQLLCNKIYKVPEAAKGLDIPKCTSCYWFKKLVEGLEIAKTDVHDFMANDCVLTIKKAQNEPEERNSSASIEVCFKWVTNLKNTDIDFQSNRISIDESFFCINLSRIMT
ncbi:hypothetical protein CU098_005065 [Rhizopus stolonifer]|uniref:Uncharacterized protein n=1 Tax=Rhizopus stolonifer TaxID=4846 RepID=A0A367JSE5_RHIST|nr:hypothetical protein CU098_005065 [Rhizopus stolonifer]